MGGIFPDLAAYSDFTTGQKTVATAGTAVQLISSVKTVHAVVVKALPGNTGKVCVGPKGTTYAGNNGYVLEAGVAISFPIADLSKVWIDAQTNGDGVCWLSN